MPAVSSTHWPLQRCWPSGQPESTHIVPRHLVPTPAGHDEQTPPQKRKPEAQVAPQSAACMAERAASFPGLTLQHIDTMFASRTIDVVDLSTYLGSESTYASWGITIDEAQTAAWQEATRRGWPSEVTLQARKAMAFPGTFSGDRGQVERNLHTYAGIPVSAGAAAVDIWTWRQTYDGHIVHLMNPGLTPNPLWRGLVRLHDQGSGDLNQLASAGIQAIDGRLGTNLGVFKQGQRFLNPPALAAAADEAPARYISATVLRRHWMDFCALERFRDRAQLLREHVFPSARYMRAKYPNQARRSLPWLYFKRAIDASASLVRTWSGST